MGVGDGGWSGAVEVGCGGVGVEGSRIRGRGEGGGSGCGRWGDGGGGGRCRLQLNKKSPTYLKQRLGREEGGNGSSVIPLGFVWVLKKGIRRSLCIQWRQKQIND